jgi:hypothetical protein
MKKLLMLIDPDHMKTKCLTIIFLLLLICPTVIQAQSVTGAVETSRQKRARDRINTLTVARLIENVNHTMRTTVVC